MQYLRTYSLLAVMALAIATPAMAATSEEQRVAEAADTLDQLLRIPESSIPPSLLARAYAVAVIPDVIKAGFVFGGRRGKGIIVVRMDDDSWSNPAFVTMTGGSVGWQAGVQSTDVILVFKTRQGVQNIENGTMTLGADASVAAGPVGRTASAATDLKFDAEVVSYSRSKGLFAGVSFEGANITMDRKANSRFYGSSSMSPEKIFASSPNIAPDVANTFVQILSAQTHSLPSSPGLQGVASTAPGPMPQQQAPQAEEQTEVRTFGMPDPED
jgi:lipid-binding SYLF domain-containing protein